MALYEKVVLILVVIAIIQCEAQIEIHGSCSNDLGSKLSTNWLAMSGKWYEVMRSSHTSPLQSGTYCGTLDIMNVDRNMQVNHSYTNKLNQRKNNPSKFELSSQPTMNMCFSPGVTKSLTLIGTDYSNFAAFTYCTPATAKTSKIYFWIFCRQNTLTTTCRNLVTYLFKLRKIENMLAYLEYTDQQSCAA